MKNKLDPKAYKKNNNPEHQFQSTKLYFPNMSVHLDEIVAARMNDKKWRNTIFLKGGFFTIEEKHRAAIIEETRRAQKIKRYSANNCQQSKDQTINEHKWEKSSKFNKYNNNEPSIPLTTSFQRALRSYRRKHFKDQKPKIEDSSRSSRYFSKFAYELKILQEGNTVIGNKTKLNSRSLNLSPIYKEVKIDKKKKGPKINLFDATIAPWNQEEDSYI